MEIIRLVDQTDLPVRATLRDHPQFQSAIAEIDGRMTAELAHLREMEQDCGV